MLGYTKYAEILLPDLCFRCFVGFFLKDLLFYIYECFAYLYVCELYVSGTHGFENSMSDPLELEL